MEFSQSCKNSQVVVTSTNMINKSLESSLKIPSNELSPIDYQYHDDIMSIASKSEFHIYYKRIQSRAQEEKSAVF